MKFDFDIEKCGDVGLIVKYGNSNNVVFFFDENEDATSYSLELYRLDFDMGNNGFLREVCEIQRVTAVKYFVTSKESYVNECLTEPGNPYYRDHKLISQYVWEEEAYNPSRVKRVKILEYPFDQVKPICTIPIDRNTFYTSIDFLPEGRYICVLKIEDRMGEIIKRSVPYYFKVKASADISKQLAGIQSTVRTSGRHVVTNS